VRALTKFVIIFLQLFEAQETAATAARAIYAFMRKSIEVRYGVTGPPPPKTEGDAMDTQ
jgi:hypothetical protein